MNILKEILAYKKQEMEVRKLLVPEKELYKSVFFKRKCLSLLKSLHDPKRSGIIAEFKRRTPPAGFLNKDADVKTVTNAYTANGAAGLSILTDKYFFGGNSADLVAARGNKIPIVRKDFVIDPYDLLVSKAIGADVVLLVASCLAKDEVKLFASYSRQLGMEVLLEIQDEKEIGHISEEVDMVMINNRDLRSFKLDMKRSLRLSKSVIQLKPMLAEGGIESVADARLFRDAGYLGVFMGERFMREPDPGKAFQEFVQALKKDKIKN